MKRVRESREEEEPRWSRNEEEVFWYPFNKSWETCQVVETEKQRVVEA